MLFGFVVVKILKKKALDLLFVFPYPKTGTSPIGMVRIGHIIYFKTQAVYPIVKLVLKIFTTPFLFKSNGQLVVALIV